jgi:dienelactone hydrolase
MSAIFAAMRRDLPLLAALLLTACPSAEPEPVPEPTPTPSPDWCRDGRALSIAHGRRTQPIGVYPDDHYARPDANTRTGLKVHLEPDQNPLLVANFPPEWAPIFDDISGLDGWGLTAGIVFGFEFSLDPAAVTPESVRVVAFEPEGPVVYPVDVELTAFPNTLIARPRLPLPPSTEVAAVVLQGPLSSDGTCVRPAEHLRELLSPASELAPGVPAHVLSPRYLAALDALDLGPADVAHMTVFTTQSTTFDSLDVLADVQARTYAFDGPLACAPAGGDAVDCEGSLTVMDYRGPDGRVPVGFTGDPSGQYALPVSITLPGPPSAGPYPVILIGHGLGGSRNNQGGATEELTSLGLAVVATDAIEHGDHPTRSDPDGDSITSALDFFAIVADPDPSIDAPRLRDNFRQSAWDRIQVYEAVRQGIDVDGDGADDLDPANLMYFGASLGGMMGSETMALTGDLKGGMLAITGGRITQVVTTSDLFGAILDVMVPPGYGRDDLARVIPLVQAVVDGGDPMVWARYIVRERLVGDATDPPQLLVHYAFQDEVVPNPTNRNHAHGLGVPLVGRELFPLEELDKVAGPLSGNLPNGGTAGLQILDMGRPMNNPEGTASPVDHAGVLRTYESWSVWRPFLESALADEPGVIADPYASP